MPQDDRRAELAQFEKLKRTIAAEYQTTFMKTLN